MWKKRQQQQLEYKGNKMTTISTPLIIAEIDDNVFTDLIFAELKNHFNSTTLLEAARNYVQNLVRKISCFTVLLT